MFGSCRLRAHARTRRCGSASTANDPTQRQSSASAGTTCPSARYTTENRRATRCASRKPGRSAAASSSTRGCRLDERSNVSRSPVARGADHPRPRRVHERRRAASGRPPIADVHARVGSRLRARHALGARRHHARRRLVPVDDASNYLGTYTFESLAAFEAGHAAQLHAAHRRSDDRLLQRAGRRSTSRTTSACART